MNGILETGADLLHPVAHLPTEDEARRIRQHLDVLLTDPLFTNSKRMPAFLRHIVQEALAGHSDEQLKERTLGVAVFGRSPDYDTNADPVVRMTAGEVRKKLAQYYYANHDTEIQIEIPLGSYMPRFRYAPTLSEAPINIAAVATPEPPQTPVSQAKPSHTPPRRAFGWVAGLWVIFGVALLAAGFFIVHGMRTTAVDRFWASFTEPSHQALIVLPALSRVPQALPLYHFEAESVALEDAKVATRVSNELKLRHSSSTLAFSTATSLSDLRANPFVLIGGLDNVWTMRLSQTLPFAFERSDDRRYGRIVDRKNPTQSWAEDFSIPNAEIPQDYGIIARFTDPTTEQPTLVIAGISAEGTLAAGEAVTTPRYLDMLLKAAGNPPNGFEAVIETRVIDGRSGPPTIVAMRTW